MVQITSIWGPRILNRKTYADNTSHKSETVLQYTMFLNRDKRKQAKKLFFFFSLQQNTITLNRIRMFRLCSNKHRTACTVDRVLQHCLWNTKVTISTWQAAGRQAGNVNSLIQQAVIEPAGKCRLSKDSVVVIVYEGKRREEQAYEYSEIRKGRRQEGW